MGRFLSEQRKEGIQREIRKMGLNRIIRDFVIDLSPFIVPPDRPTNNFNEYDETHYLRRLPVESV